MKTIFTLLTSILFLATTTYSQAIYKINSSETWNNNGNSYPNPCFKCTFILADDAVLTIEKDVTFSDVKFEGGSIVVKNRNLMLWTSGGKNYFNNTRLSFLGDGQFTGNGPIVLNNSAFTFFNKSNLLSNHSLEMFSSNIAFREKSFLVGQGSIVSLTNSHLVAGDGLLSSTANIQMNGAKLVLQDKTSGVEILNKNNYYFNWSNYSVAASNQTFKTTDNKLNCGATGTNSCSAPFVYGPVAITPTGLGSTIILPVVIADFTAAASNKSVALNWSTRQESNSAYFTIERSNDGLGWSPIGQVKAAGNSNLNTKYNFSDFALINGVAQYRLKMVDLDGRFVYSDVKTVRTTSIVTIKAYPNPATEFVNITLDAKAGKSSIQLINQGGQVVKQAVTQPGNILVRLNVATVQDGIYTVKIVDENGTNQAARIIIQNTK